MLSLDDMMRYVTKAIGSFQPNELAYYALTSKPELPIRDKLAYQIHLTRDRETIVAREWTNVDLAVLKNGKPETVIELKCLYTFDLCVPSGVNQYRKYVAGDMQKREALLHKENVFYSIVILTHPRSRIPPEYKSIIKYSHNINTRLAQNQQSHEAIFKLATDEWTKILNKCSLQFKVETFDLGSVFDIKVDLIVYVMQKHFGFDVSTLFPSVLEKQQGESAREGSVLGIL